LRILFVHQGFPGQFRYLAPTLAARGEQVVFLSLPTPHTLKGIRQVFYDLVAPPREPDDGFLGHVDNALQYARAAADAAHRLKAEGFTPDLILAHPGWGESLFLKDVFPRSILVHFLEFFSRPENSFYDFDRPEPLPFEERASLRMRNFTHLMALDSGDWGWSPTRWQKSLFPSVYHSRISVLHDGINTRRFQPRDDLSFALAGGRALRRGMPVVTFIARNLEPCRGFDSFMRAIELVLARHSTCDVLIFGGDGVNYGPQLRGGGTYRERVLRELALDPQRVHFLGQVPQPEIVAALAVSAVHVFLTYPFLISWSILEAMAMECVVIGSATPPVMEIIAHGSNGFLVDFFDHQGLADRICAVLGHPHGLASLRRAARATVLERFDAQKNLARQLALLSLLHAGSFPPPEPLAAAPEEAAALAAIGA
jgi:glycosyltransferase involved in cell wall biosynthesis